MCSSFFAPRNMLCLVFFVVSCLWTSCGDNDVEDPSSDSANYNISVSLNWNGQDYPTDYPSNNHFSKLIGWSHVPGSDFFRLGTLATKGIEEMAEKGDTSPLDDEIIDRIEQGEGFDMVIGSGLSSGTGEILVEIAVDKYHPAVTLATMIAPSPDWYVAIVNIPLLENGEFVLEKIVDGHVYDAGTDLGETYKSRNIDADPPEPISLFVKSPMGNGSSLPNTIATVKFSKQ